MNTGHIESEPTVHTAGSSESLRSRHLVSYFSQDRRNKYLNHSHAAHCLKPSKRTGTAQVGLLCQAQVYAQTHCKDSRPGVLWLRRSFPQADRSPGCTEPAPIRRQTGLPAALSLPLSFCSYQKFSSLYNWKNRWNAKLLLTSHWRMSTETEVRAFLGGKEWSRQRRGKESVPAPETEEQKEKQLVLVIHDVRLGVLKASYHSWRWPSWARITLSRSWPCRCGSWAGGDQTTLQDGERLPKSLTWLSVFLRQGKSQTI